MGCDIHAHIERKKHHDSGYWTFASLRCEPRQYMLFGYLTGGEVRYDNVPDWCREGFQPRGIPDQIDSDTADDYYEHESKQFPQAEVAQAVEEWAKRLPRSARFHQGRYAGDAGPVTVSVIYPNPDWHTPSWVTTDELSKCLDAMAAEAWSADAYWYAALASMRLLEEAGTPARLVFWFDN